MPPAFLILRRVSAFSTAYMKKDTVRCPCFLAWSGVAIWEGLCYTGEKRGVFLWQLLDTVIGGWLGMTMMAH